MGPAPTTGEEKNFDEGVIDTYTDNGNGTSTVNLSIGLTDEADRYEEGKIEINGAGTFTVVSNTDNLVSDDDVVIQGTPGSTVVGKSFKIYDDDYVAIGSRAPHTMPYALSGGTLMQTAYADAYIKPVDVPSQYIDTNIAFDRNLTETEALLKMAAGSAGKDLSDAPNFWVVHLLASWQGGTGDDLDPSIGNAQSLLGLGSDPFNSGFIFVETIREGESLPSTPRTTEEHTVVHEVGHQGGAPHDDGGIMAPGAPINENKFKPVTIKRFRDESSF